MSQKPRNAFLIVLYALTVGSIYTLPHLWIWQDAGEKWGSPHLNMPDELGAYAGRIRALYNGEKLGPASQTLACPDEDTHLPAAGEYVTCGWPAFSGWVSGDASSWRIFSSPHCPFSASICS